VPDEFTQDLPASVLLAIAVAGIALLLFLVIKLKLHAFVALLVVSVVVALAAGLPLDLIIPTLEDGIGGTLANVAVIVALGAMLGKMLEISGGAETLARRMVRRFGEERAPLAMGVTALIFGIRSSSTWG
jgi:GntP family gluconate:H+ symporter